MFSMNLNQIIRSVYDMNEPTMLDVDYKTGIQDSTGLLFAFDISVSYWLKGEQYNERRKVYVALGRHKAWCAETSMRYRPGKDFNKLNWVNVGNHDSCWINSVESWLNALYFNLCHSIRDDIEYDSGTDFGTYCHNTLGVTPPVIPQSKGIAPNDCHVFISEPLCEKLFTPVFLKFTKENDEYRRELLMIEYRNLQTV